AAKRPFSPRQKNAPALAKATLAGGKQVILGFKNRMLQPSAPLHPSVCSPVCSGSFRDVKRNGCMMVRAVIALICLMTLIPAAAARDRQAVTEGGQQRD